MYEGSRCIAKNLPSLKSGDRVRLKVERGFGHMRVWINEHELGTTISGFQVQTLPEVVVKMLFCICLPNMPAIHRMTLHSESQTLILSVDTWKADDWDVG